MQHTAKELIERLQKEYDPEETLAYTIYSKADVAGHNDTMSFDKADEIWNDVVDKFDDAIDDAQSDLNQTLSELVEDELGEGEDD
jgi:hypothetical protein